MSIVYWGVLLTVIGCGSIAENNPKQFGHKKQINYLRPDPVMAFVLSSVLILVSGLRFQVGTDYMSYYQWSIPEWSTVWNNLINFREGGFFFLVKISRIIWNDNQSIILFSAIITVGLFCWTIYNQSNTYLLSILLYLFLGQWQGSFNAIRQYLAASVLFSGYHYILEKNYIKYLLIVFLATTFHISSIVMIIPCFLFHNKPSIIQLICLAIGSIILRFSYDTVFDIIGLLRGQTMTIDGSIYRSNDINPLRIVVGFIPVFIYIVFCEKENHTPKQNFYINAIFFNAFAMLASTGSAYLGRIGMFTNGFLVLGYYELLRLIREEKTRGVIIFLVLIIYFVYWLYSIQAGKIATFRWYMNP